MGIPRHGLAATLWDGPAATDRRVYEDPSQLLPEERRRPMPAAEPADPILPAPLGDRGEQAAVIDLTYARARRPGKGRRQVSTPQPAPEPGGGPAALEQLAERFEIAFNRHGLTLTDTEAALAYRITLDLMRDFIFRGAEAQNIVDGGQRRKLDELVVGIRVVPELVERSG